MKFNATWQLSLYTVALLTTLIACDSRESRLSERKDMQENTPPTAASKGNAKAPAMGNSAAPGEYKAAAYNVTTDSEGEAVTSEKREDNETPQGAGQQSPKPPQQPSIQQAPAPRVDWDKKIIKTANLQVEVADYKKYNVLVRAAIKAAGGYVANEEQNESEYKIENTVTLKVPVDQFDEAVAALTPGQEKIRMKKITAEDVTGEVVDTRSRLEAKKQVRLRYLDLLRQAKNMEEILQVQNDINDLQENIEAAVGRVQYLMHSAAFSTIQLSFYQVLNPTAVNNDVPPGFGKRVLDGLGAGLAWIGELLILLVTLWPLWAVVAILWWLVRKYRLIKKLIGGSPALARQPIGTTTDQSVAPDKGSIVP